MTMYEELVKMLRTCSERDSCFWLGDTCPYLNSELCSDKSGKAADAIEELQSTIKGFKAQTDLAIVEEKGRTLLKIVPKWIPTSERLPEESRHYLIYVIGGEFKQWSMVTMAYYHKRFYYDNMEDNFDQVTHWMPLPEPPKADKDGAE